MCIAFRKHTLLSLDDCLYALQVTRIRDKNLPILIPNSVEL